VTLRLCPIRERETEQSIEHEGSRQIRNHDSDGIEACWHGVDSVTSV
jgi:hypothetical protein